MGYGASKHMNAIKELGNTQFHRLSFNPCCNIVKKNIVQKNNKKK